MRKSATNTSEYQICVEDMLRRGTLHFYRDIFTNSKRFLKGSADDTKKIEDELRQQFERYHWEVKEAKDNFGKKKVTMTGKMGGAKDDLYVAVAMLAYWGQFHRYETRRTKRGRFDI